MKLLFVRATQELRGETVSEEYTSQNTFFHILDSVIVCRSHEKQDKGTSDAEPEPGPGLVLRCVAFRVSFALMDHTLQMFCVFISGEGREKQNPATCP